MKSNCKYIVCLWLISICCHLFAYNGGYENSLMEDTKIGGVVYKGYGNNTLTKRSESGTTIDSSMYAQCKALKSVDLTGVTSIGDAAFAYSALESVTIPSTVSSMGFIAFGGCTNLKHLSVSSWSWYDVNKEPLRDCASVELLSANCGTPSWDITKVFPNLTTVRCPSKEIASWQSKYPKASVVDIKSTYVVSYRQNGGDMHVTDCVVAVGAAEKIKSPSNLKFERSGYSFLGWAKTADPTEVYYLAGQSVTDIIDGGKTRNLYAVWSDSSNAYRVRYWKNDKPASANSTVSVLCGSENKLCTPSLLGWSRDGCQFLGWAKSAEATEAYYLGGQTTSDLADATKVRDLYAVWIKSSNAYRIRYWLNDGSNRNSTQGYIRDTDGKLCTPSLLCWNRDGCQFLGWAKSAEATEAYYLGGQVAKNLADAGNVRELYAVWALKSNTYRIKYVKNDGSSVNSTQGYEWDVERPLTKASTLGWTVNGKTFAGWAKKSGATTADYAAGQYVKNLTGKGSVIELFAVWEAAKSLAYCVANSEVSSSANKLYFEGNVVDSGAFYRLVLDDVAADEERTGYVVIDFDNGESIRFECTVEFTDTVIIVTDSESGNVIELAKAYL